MRSINNKTDDVMNFIVDKNISIFFVCETWLTDKSNHTTATIKSYGFKIYHSFRSNSHGGGVAIVYKSGLTLTKVSINHSSSFESISVKFKSDNRNMFCSCIYRTGQIGSFLSDFDQFLGNVFTRFERILICGDFNLHLDVSTTCTHEFTEILSSYGLVQHTNGSTHKGGHLLDLVISSNKLVMNNVISILKEHTKSFPSCDHYPLFFTLDTKRPDSNVTKEICCRNIKNIDCTSFRKDITTCIRVSLVSRAHLALRVNLP